MEMEGSSVSSVYLIFLYGEPFEGGVDNQILIDVTKRGGYGRSLDITPWVFSVVLENSLRINDST